MKSKKLSIKKVAKKVGHAACNGVKIAVATVAAFATAEAAFAGAEMAQNDAKFVKEAVVYKVNPNGRTPYKVKNGVFGKTEIVSFNPVTGKADPYTGSNKPVNKKTINMKKVK